MNIADTLSNLPQDQIFNKSRFREAVHTVDPDCTESTINWMLVTMRKQGLLASAGTGKYYCLPSESDIKKDYRYPHSPEYQEIEQTVTDTYPLVNFQMWELIQMNDFVNHQIAKNVIFIEVESMLVDTVYEMLHEKYPYAMIQPNADTFYKQRAPETDIIVQKLLTEAPTPNDRHSSPLEKLLVDLLSKKLSGNLIERSEYPRIYEDIFRKYLINETRMFRYAKRRHLYDTLLSFIQTQTSIKLMTI
ncbi:MAG: hypothetical protein IJ716_15830 [Lachnospiraceae bacterium]|nr:hypothetical protein [Lachnospiraceae bacterium]